MERLLDGRVALVTGRDERDRAGDGQGIRPDGGADPDRGPRSGPGGRRRPGRSGRPPAPRAEVLVADLSSREQVRRLAGEVRDRSGRLDLLVNNAGAIFAERRLSADGVEMTLALNHLAYFLLTLELLPLLVRRPRRGW